MRIIIGALICLIGLIVIGSWKSKNLCDIRCESEMVYWNQEFKGNTFYYFKIYKNLDFRIPECLDGFYEYSYNIDPRGNDRLISLDFNVLDTITKMDYKTFYSKKIPFSIMRKILVGIYVLDVNSDKAKFYTSQKEIDFFLKKNVY